MTAHVTFALVVVPVVPSGTMMSRRRQDGWNAQKLKEHMETYLQKKASESESEATISQWHRLVVVVVRFGGLRIHQEAMTAMVRQNLANDVWKCRNLSFGHKFVTEIWFSCI